MPMSLCYNTQKSARCLGPKEMVLKPITSILKSSRYNVTFVMLSMYLKEGSVSHPARGMSHVWSSNVASTHER